MGMQLPGAWPGVPTQAQIPATAQQLAQAGVGGALPQATGVVAYPMQQFQVSPESKHETDITNNKQTLGIYS